MHGILGIDHPVIAVKDMDASRALYERMGFTVPPRGRHLEWGTGNWCIMFPRDYLELRGIIDPAKYTHGLEDFLSVREGLMGVAFATADARASHDSLAAAGLHPRPVRDLTRLFELPENPVQPRFSLCFLDEAETPGLMSVVLCQHRTPELIRRPEFLVHANTAVRVAGMTAVVEDLDSAAAAYRRLFGDGAVEERDGGVAIRTGAATIRVVEPEGLAAAHPGCAYGTPPAPPYLAAVTVAVADMGKARGALDAGGVPYLDHGTVLRIAPRDAGGMILEFAAE